MSSKNPVKLLIVDDSMVFCRFLSTQLTKIDPRIQVVGYSGNAYDASQKIKSLKPDVISLDVEMPGMNGLEFLQKLIRFPWFWYLPSMSMCSTLFPMEL